MRSPSREHEPVTIGNWILTIIVLSLPLIGFIMQIVWAVSSDTHPSKRTFCQAGLVLLAIAIVLAGLAIVFFGGMAAILDATSRHAN